MTLAQRIKNLFWTLLIELILTTMRIFFLRVKTRQWKFLTKHLQLKKTLKRNRLSLKTKKNRNTSKENKLFNDVTIKSDPFLKAPQRKKTYIQKVNDNTREHRENKRVNEKPPKAKGNNLSEVEYIETKPQHPRDRLKQNVREKKEKDELQVLGQRPMHLRDRKKLKEKKLAANNSKLLLSNFDFNVYDLVDKSTFLT